jgi:exopolyphosphatase/guanosine-5'-triphosphate,3'-diphosphate pyrophosphatase
VRRRRVLSPASVPLGVVRLTRRFLRHDPPSPRELRALRLEVRRALLRALPVGRRGEALVGLGGTVRALARMHLAARGDERTPGHGLRLRTSQVTALREALPARPVDERRELPGLEAARADVVLAGAIVFEEVMLLGGWPVLLVCAQGVRHGLLLREAFA